MKYRPFVQVYGAESCWYWNPLSEAKASEAEAEAVIAAYIESKKVGSNGFRKGAPGRCKVSPVLESM
jgi:hypothetical protein